VSTADAEQSSAIVRIVRKRAPKTHGATRARGRPDGGADHFNRYTV
jgi:hypothetical protein